MKDKIIAALKSMYSSKYSLSDKAWAGIAAMVGINVTEESQINAAISSEGVVEALGGVQSYGDGRAAAAKPEPAKPEPAKPEPTTEPVKPVEEVPAWFKSFSEQITGTIKTVTDKLETIETGKVTDTRKATLLSKLEKVSDTVKGPILEAFEYMQFNDDAQFTGYLEKLQPKIDAAIQADATAKVDGVTPPIYGDGKAGNSFADLMKGLNPPATTPAAPAAPAAV